MVPVLYFVHTVFLLHPPFRYKPRLSTISDPCLFQTLRMLNGDKAASGTSFKKNYLYAIQTGLSSNRLLCQVMIHHHGAASILNCHGLSCSLFWISILSVSLRYNIRYCTVTTSSRWMNSLKAIFYSRSVYGILPHNKAIR